VRWGEEGGGFGEVAATVDLGEQSACGDCPDAVGGVSRVGGHDTLVFGEDVAGGDGVEVWAGPSATVPGGWSWPVGMYRRVTEA
jgi:hypothetical protein